MQTSQVVPLILSVMDGYPSLLLAYGELGSGWNFSNFIPSIIIIIILNATPSQAKAPLCLAPRATQVFSAAASGRCSGSIASLISASHSCKYSGWPYSANPRVNRPTPSMCPSFSSPPMLPLTSWSIAEGGVPRCSSRQRTPLKAKSYSDLQAPDVRHDARGSSLVNVSSVEVNRLQAKCQNKSKIQIHSPQVPTEADAIEVKTFHFLQRCCVTLFCMHSIVPCNHECR
jgi:hypothetical protein